MNRLSRPRKIKRYSLTPTSNKTSTESPLQSAHQPKSTFKLLSTMTLWCCRWPMWWTTLCSWYSTQKLALWEQALLTIWDSTLLTRCWNTLWSTWWMRDSSLLSWIQRCTRRDFKGQWTTILWGCLLRTKTKSQGKSRKCLKYVFWSQMKGIELNIIKKVKRRDGRDPRGCPTSSDLIKKRLGLFTQ